MGVDARGESNVAVLLKSIQDAQGRGALWLCIDVPLF